MRKYNQYLVHTFSEVRNQDTGPSHIYVSTISSDDGPYIHAHAASEFSTPALIESEKELPEEGTHTSHQSDAYSMQTLFPLHFIMALSFKIPILNEDLTCPR